MASRNRRIVVLGGSSTVTGGLERYCQRMCRCLTEGGIPVSAIPTDSAVLRQPGGIAAVPRVVRAVSAVARELDTDGDVAWLQYGNGLDALLLGALRRSFAGRVLVTVHAGPQWLHLRLPLLRRLAATALRGADAVCVLSGEQEDLLRAAGVRRVRRIPTLLPEAAFAPANGLGRNGLLFVGRVVPEKGLDDLLDVWEEIRAATGATLTIVGEGPAPFVEELRARADRGAAGRAIVWLGGTGEREVAELMRRAAVLVQPSYADALPLSVLEALAAGVHVVAYGLPATRALLERYGGVAVPPGDRAALAREVIAALQASSPTSAGAQVRTELAWPVVREIYAELAFGNLEANA